MSESHNTESKNGLGVSEVINTVKPLSTESKNGPGALEEAKLGVNVEVEMKVTTGHFPLLANNVETRLPEINIHLHGKELNILARAISKASIGVAAQRCRSKLAESKVADQNIAINSKSGHFQKWVVDVPQGTDCWLTTKEEASKVAMGSWLDSSAGLIRIEAPATDMEPKEAESRYKGICTGADLMPKQDKIFAKCQKESRLGVAMNWVTTVRVKEFL